jgi:hypothetical protein
LSKKSEMNSKAASRILSHADKTGTNAGFKSRAQAAAAKNGKEIKVRKKRGWLLGWVSAGVAQPEI